MALDPSDPWNYLSLANALNFNGRPKEALSYLDAAARVDPNSWMDYRRYQAGLAEFGQEKFEDAVRSIEKMDLESPEPWAKFYALQVLVSAYAHLGRTEQAAAALERLRKVVARRMEYEPNQLITQDYMVFKNTADIERLLAGLSKAGVPDLPALASAGMNAEGPAHRGGNKVSHLRPRNAWTTMFPEFLPMQRTTSADGAVSETVGPKTRDRNVVGARQLPVQCLSGRADKLRGDFSQSVQDAGAPGRIQGRLPLGAVRVFGRQMKQPENWPGL